MDWSDAWWGLRREHGGGGSDTGASVWAASTAPGGRGGAAGVGSPWGQGRMCCVLVLSSPGCSWMSGGGAGMWWAWRGPWGRVCSRRRPLKERGGAGGEPQRGPGTLQTKGHVANAVGTSRRGPELAWEGARVDAARRQHGAGVKGEPALQRPWMPGLGAPSKEGEGGPFLPLRPALSHLLALLLAGSPGPWSRDPSSLGRNWEQALFKAATASRWQHGLCGVGVSHAGGPPTSEPAGPPRFCSAARAIVQPGRGGPGPSPWVSPFLSPPQRPRQLTRALLPAEPVFLWPSVLWPMHGSSLSG